MAQQCAICGASINLVQQQKLADGNFICRKTCKKKGMTSYFDFMHSDLPTVQAHIAQVEKGAKIFNELFLPRKKGKVKGAKVKQFGSDLWVAEDIGLMALTEAKYKFWIFGKYFPKACVYRIGDLYGYDSEMTTHAPDGKAEIKKKVHFIFRGGEGMTDFFYEYSDKEIAKYFNKLFGIEKTLRNIGNTWKNQINAIKSTAGAVGAIAGDKEGAEEKTGEAIDALNVAQFGDRTEILAKADAALAPYID